MNNSIELIEQACNKFKNGEYSIEDLSRFLASVAVSKDLYSILLDAENRLEEIRFLVSDNEQYNSVLVFIDKLLKDLDSFKMR